MTTAVVAGCIANRYLYGGGAWVRRSWAEGLRAVGFDVFFLEHILPEKCVGLDGSPSLFDASANKSYFDEVTASFGLRGRSALVLGDGQRVHGATRAEVLDRLDDASLLVNISGNLQLEDLKQRAGTTVYLDVDPGWTQTAAAARDWGPRLQNHDRYFTIGENIGKDFCPIETGDVRWGTVRQPVILDDWPVTDSPDPLSFTTIATLKGPGPFPRAKIGGRMHGLKGDEFKEFLELPGAVEQRCEIALKRTQHWDDQAGPLLDHGWNVVDAADVSSHPDTFRDYVLSSGSEFSTARGVYVHTASGWFSDRTIRYLAAGRPALVQDTGFSVNIPTGEGLLRFSTLEEAVAGAKSIAGDYERHAKAARALAAEYFDATSVLRDFIEDVGVAP